MDEKTVLSEEQNAPQCNTDENLQVSKECESLSSQKSKESQEEAFNENITSTEKYDQNDFNTVKCNNTDACSSKINTNLNSKLIQGLNELDLEEKENVSSEKYDEIECNNDRKVNDLDSDDSSDNENMLVDNASFNNEDEENEEMDEEYIKWTKNIKNDINILLLGETGVGKSTFINSLANYLKHNTLEKALGKDVTLLIPVKFSILDENYENRYIRIGDDQNENNEIGASSTQGAKGYEFSISGTEHKINLIDTPGIGDARGLAQDKLNFENILTYLSQFKELHAICFLLKPNVSVINPYFKFCITFLLSRLEKSASQNIIFLYTNSRSTFYRPGETLPILKKVLEEVRSCPPHVKIPCAKNNMFCLDNEAFKFLVAIKSGIEFGDRELTEYSASWKTSVEVVWNLLKYVTGDDKVPGLPTHQIQNTLSVNEVRRMIIDLSKPLAEIADVIEDNLVVLERHTKTITESSSTIAELESNLYVPVIDIEQVALDKPITVCTATRCSEIYTLAGMSKYHYKQECHKPCYLQNVPREIIGSPELQRCFAMGGTSTCSQCKCDFKLHMHIMYESKLIETKIIDESVKTKIQSNEEKNERLTNLVNQLLVRSEEFKREKDIIRKKTAKFAHFLSENSMALYNDSFIDYLDYLIEREEQLTINKDKDVIKRYRCMKKEYEQEKDALNEALKCRNQYESSVNSTHLTAEELTLDIKELYTLKHMGEKIKSAHKEIEKARENSHKYNMSHYNIAPKTYATPYYPQNRGKNQGKKSKGKISVWSKFNLNLNKFFSSNE